MVVREAVEMEFRVLAEIEKRKSECLIFDCDLVIDTFEILSRVWNDVCELYSFQKLTKTYQRKLFQKDPKTISKILISRGKNEYLLFLIVL
jgi:beta-phosphoglucomutase-like phosphatase (HAD superfamily)